MLGFMQEFFDKGKVEVQKFYELLDNHIKDETEKNARREQQLEMNALRDQTQAAMQE